MRQCDLFRLAIAQRMMSDIHLNDPLCRYAESGVSSPPRLEVTQSGKMETMRPFPACDCTADDVRYAPDASSDNLPRLFTSHCVYIHIIELVKIPVIVRDPVWSQNIVADMQNVMLWYAKLYVFCQNVHDAYFVSMVYF